MSRKIFKRILIFLFFPFLVFIYLFKIIDEGYLFHHLKCVFPETLVYDFAALNSAVQFFEINLYNFDKKLNEYSTNEFYFKNKDCFEKNFTLAIEYKQIERLGIDVLLKKFRETAFEAEVFYVKKQYFQMVEFENKLPAAILLKKSLKFILLILYPREENTWWFGHYSNDENCLSKLRKLSFPELCQSKWPEFLINRYKFTEQLRIEKMFSHILLLKEKNEKKKLHDELEHSKFLECNFTRALLFKSKFGEEKNSKAARFKHRAHKILSKAKAILDFLSISFWLSSGTCLGFFRECDIIVHSKDVDIGIFATEFNETIIDHLTNQSLKLKHRFGLPNDSLELSFIDNGGVKLDVFFFYVEKTYIWNGGTQLKTGRKFKYIFPLFELCWTFFSGLKVRVPCETEEYIIANYGNNWFTPIKYWDWKSSPNNVYPNGVWSHSRLNII